MAARFFTALIVGAFLLGLLCTGVLGTETRLLFFWPGAVLLGAAAAGAALRWRWRLMFAPADVCLASVLLLAAYLVARQLTSPVTAHAREDLGQVLARQGRGDDAAAELELARSAYDRMGAASWVARVDALTGVRV